MYVNLGRIGMVLEKQFPDLSNISPLKRLGDGFSSRVVETADGIVFRIAKYDQAGHNFEKEWLVLPHLQKHLSVAIPHPQWFSPKSEGLPFGAIGYPKLGGHVFTSDLVEMADLPQLADSVASFLLELHQITGNFDGLHVMSAENWHQHHLTMWSTVKMPLHDAVSASEFQRMESWWEKYLADERMYQLTPTLIHGDLWYENWLVDESLSRLVGVLDWENVAVSDPALDFVPQFYLGHTFAEKVIVAYQQGGGMIDAKMLRRIHHLHIVREFEGLAYAIRYNDAEEFEDAVGKIRRSGIFDE